MLSQRNMADGRMFVLLYTVWTYARIIVLLQTEFSQTRSSYLH